MAIAQLSIVPLGTGGTSLSPYVADIHKALDQLGIQHTLTPMGTVLEGSLGQILDAVKVVHELPFAGGAQRVMTLLNIDDRRDKDATAAGKIKSVQAKL